MTVPQQIEYAGSGFKGPLPLSPHFAAGLALLRLTKAGWQFDSAGDGVMVLKPEGAEWHLIAGETCDCIAYHYKHDCYHLRAVTACGGVETLLDWLERLA